MSYLVIYKYTLVDRASILESRLALNIRILGCSNQNRPRVVTYEQLDKMCLLVQNAENVSLSMTNELMSETGQTLHPTLTRNPQLQIGLGYWNEIWSVFVAPCDIRLTIQLSTLWFFGMQSAVEPTVERALEPAMHSICNQLCTLFIPLSPRHPRKRHRGKQPTSPALPSNYYRTTWNTNNRKLRH